MRFQDPPGIHSAFQASKRHIERPCLKTKILKPKPKSGCIEQLRCGTQWVLRHTFIDKHLLSTYCIPQTIFVLAKWSFCTFYLLSCPSPWPRPILNSCRDHTHLTLASWASGECKEVPLRLRPASPVFTLISGCSSHSRICRLLAMVVVR